MKSAFKAIAILKNRLDTPSVFETLSRLPMLPPVLEVYVVWHPRDAVGRGIATEIFEHFHGTTYSGLLGGAVEVYIRSAGWKSTNDAPRPIPFCDAPAVVRPARLIAVVPVLGLGFAEAVECSSSPWRSFALRILRAQRAAADRVGIFPLLADSRAIDKTELGQLFGPFQSIAAPAFSVLEPPAELRCRDLAQGLAQLAAGSNSRLQVFISHTKRSAQLDSNKIEDLVARVREVINETRLRQFFDASDLQPGQDWDATLRAEAGRSALLALRTDLYASRDWCQREMLIAKLEGMPIVTLDCLQAGEERGSFIMDHVPRIPVKLERRGWSKACVRRGLNLLVDECLKRELWRVQKGLARNRRDLPIAWWAPHAPEPITLAQWFDSQTVKRRSADIRILHPDPPLGCEEKERLQQMTRLLGHKGVFEVMTPRVFVARGGGDVKGTKSILPDDAIAGITLGISVSDSPDLPQLGLLEEHLRLALGEIARTVLVLGGKLSYGGNLDPAGYTGFLLSELKRYGRRDRPLSVILAASEHQRTTLSSLRSWEKELGLYGKLICLDASGQVVSAQSGRGRTLLGEPRNIAAALGAMRTFACAVSDARVLIGGRRTGFQGVMPGIIEEALIALESHKPLYLAGGFGGATSDIVRFLSEAAAGLLTGSGHSYSLQRDALTRLKTAIGKGGWSSLRNGLDESENRRLATTHRASEVAALVSLGLGRLARKMRRTTPPRHSAVGVYGTKKPI